MFELNYFRLQPLYKNETLNIYNKTKKWGNKEDKFIQIIKSECKGSKWFYDAKILDKTSVNNGSIRGIIKEIPEDQIKSEEEYLKLVVKSN